MPDSLSFDELRSIADALAVGFQTLLQQLEERKDIENKLKLRLQSTLQKYERADRSYQSSSDDISDWRDEITRQISSQSIHEDSVQIAISDTRVEKAHKALHRLNTNNMPVATQSRRCPVTHQTTDQEDFEHDFTTPGRIGDLGCPFAKPANGVNGGCGPDPIAEEFHGEKASARSRSSAAAGSRCPIRFLDKHSPEEVAQYFENHKHEIPRSHQICVKRYQRNEESIRELDAKYGNLVSMIQGLGNKHKQFLPHEKVADEPEPDSTKAVEQWAENVSHRSVAMDEPGRVPHFERPLRDIRVGESPSRPWGISVPVDRSPASSVTPSEKGIQAPIKPLSVDAAPDAILVDAEVEEQAEPATQKEHRSGIQPQIIFNGPVFFGYSAEQAALFLQNLNIGNGTV